ncbi:MAG: signal recognition particle-docking protein FtsY [Peptococcaceae bacterium]|jgi:fused signal recognition particle receptor|nr:signal recognition particle-docking protein FtsY [Peptococcaceae bacterium]MDH7525459.1 signal recognition particle-docking protein FtsY [Peptococcaceae bacterium]
MNIFDQVAGGLAKTKRAFFDKVAGLLTGVKPIDEELFEKLEEALIGADVGVATSLKLVGNIRKKAGEKKLREAHELRAVLEEEIKRMLAEGDHELHLDKNALNVILMVGVNGTGKTTSIGKLGYRLKKEGYSVMAAAGDTFRAAAIEQLQVWCQRSGIDLIKHNEGADPAAVVYDALQAARSRKIEVLLVDTAGRLQTKTNLMEELKKMRRVIARECPGAPQEVLLTLDAATGQNALSQAKLFSEAVTVTGVILTKLDGTARGGVILGIQDEYKLPVKFIGTGEKIADLEKFVPENFSRALLS